MVIGSNDSEVNFSQGIVDIWWQHFPDKLVSPEEQRPPPSPKKNKLQPPPTPSQKYSQNLLLSAK